MQGSVPSQAVGELARSNPARSRAVELLSVDYCCGGEVPLEVARNTHRAMVEGRSAFEHDMHQHVHKEDNVLYPRALKHEASRSARGSV